MNIKLTFLSICIIYSNILFSQTASGPLNYSGKSNLIIDGKAFTSASASACIQLTNCQNIKIQNCTFTSISTMIGVSLNGCTNIEISNCKFYSFRGGVYALNSSGVKVLCNYFETIIGPKPRGQIVQFNNVTGTGNRINYNRSEHTMGTGDPEDLINLYSCSGTSADPIQIIGNHLRGGGPSTSGGGIMVGDNGGQYILISDNLVVNPGQYGIAAPSGSNITIQNNKVFASQQTFTNVGIYVGLQSEITAGYACVASTIKVLNNQVNWTNKNGVKNGFYNCPCCSGITSSGNNFNASINASILPAAFPAGACPNPTLPLDGITLNASYLNHRVDIKWTSFGEHDIQNYVIERSTDAIHFDSIGFVLSAGSSQMQSYDWSDVNTSSLNEIRYYRIKYVNKDYSYGYSNSIAISEDLSFLSVYPNPTYNDFNVQTKMMINHLMVYRVDGSLIFEVYPETPTNSYHFNYQLSPGYYFIAVEGFEEKLIQPFIVH